MNRDFYIVCDNIRSLENIGSIFRTADAIDVKKIYLCGISGFSPYGDFEKEFQKRIRKTALGAEKTIPFEHHRHTLRLIKKMKKDRISIVALEQDKKAVLYKKFKPEFPLALVIGNEVKGISKKVLKEADKVIYLPMSGKKESLNVAVAFGVAGYHIVKSKSKN